MKVLSIFLLFTIAVACFADTIVYRGTICGWGDPSNLNQVLCKGLNPIDSCPPGFLRQQLEGNVAYCYTNSTTMEKNGAPLGRLCGGLARNLCGGFSPNEYDSKVEDTSGTVCGVVSDYIGQTCNGLPLRTCPFGYYSIDYEREWDWHACFKK
ncbi:unnamed protein product [Adineta steineri]|uniref:Uncharacterized protein n=1 Tax=Adineta steineri TaxID=433720 RepID=A0A814P5Y2_9BILA|nr:unnamed protein product [Adineta steineri]CAF1103037.1 unnamed protein product [Adineta steineri]